MSQWWGANTGSYGVNGPSSANTPAPTLQQPDQKTFSTGIKVLHSDENSNFDVVFVHGLTGDREETWKADGASTPWPAALLPSKISNARVLTFGYDAHVAHWRGMVSKNRIGNHSMNLLAAIATHREDDDTNNRPILFVCHSLGGLVCEDALVMAQQRPEKHLKNILNSTRGIVFLGTPHQGSALAHWAESVAKTIGLIKQTNPEILAVLKSESEVLERVQGSFHTMIRSRAQEGFPPIEITCFYEELPLPGIGDVVPKNSAILPGYLPIGIRRNHMDMTKFEDLNDPGFVAVAGELRRWSKALVKSPEPPSLSGLSLGGPPAQISAGTAFGLPISSIPKEFAQHLPQASMGSKERMLLKAAGKGDLREVNHLIQSGASVSAVNEEGESPLTRAIKKKHYSIAKLLFESGATTDYTGFLVEKPLHIAVKSGSVKLVELVLDNGADIDEVSGSASVLHWSIDGGRDDITALLLSRGADVNLAQHSVYAPLMDAVRAKNERLIKDLLKQGAETGVLQDQLGQTCLKSLTQSCKFLISDWRTYKYEEYVQTIRSLSEDDSEKRKALIAALKCARDNQHGEIYLMLTELKDELGM